MSIGEHAPAGAFAKPATNLRVLVVDDDPIYRETARMFLSMYGRVVTVAEHGTAGLAHLNANLFDIMIVDMEMPDMTGLEVIARTRQMQQHNEMPIIMVTSRDDAMAIDRAYELGASSFVVKPVNWTLLDHYLRFVIRAAHNETNARRAQASAEAMSRTKDNLLAVVRHEMKTPLNAIIGFTKLAAEARESGDLTAMREHLAIVSSSGAKLLSSFQDMSLYSDLISGRLALRVEDMPLSWLIDDVCEAMAVELSQAGISLMREEGETGLSAQIDPALLGAALRKIVDNVIQHAKEAEQLRIRISKTAQNAVLIEIADDGEGMEPDHVAACLAPFSQADMSFSRQNQGLGLGLPIALEVMRLHGGTLEMQSSPGAGTVVSLLLPNT